MALGELLPDQPDRDNPGVIRAEGCFPALTSYKPFPSPVDVPAISANIDGNTNGGNILFAPDGTRHKYIGNPQRIQSGDQYQINIGNYIGLALDWEFVAFGDSFYATNSWDILQSGVMGAGTVADVVGAPRASTLDVVREFIMCGRDRTVNDQTVSWSALGDPTDWAPSITTQAGQQILNSGGAIQKIIGGEFATIFCKSSIWRATYVGTPLIFQFDEVEKGRGAFDNGSVIRIGELMYFLDATGFYVFDGVNSQAIASQKIVDTFFEDMARTSTRRMNVAADEAKNLIFWWYRDKLGANKVMVYNWVTQRWTGPTILDVDHAMWDPEFDALSLFTTVPTQSFFLLNGTPPLTATIETAEESPNKAGQAVVNAARPVVDGNTPTITVELGSRDSTSGAVSYTAPLVTNSDGGWADVSANARYHRTRFTVAGDYEDISGLEYDWRATGGR